MIRHVCSYCWTQYKTTATDQSGISHGICPKCWDELKAAPEDKFIEVHNELVERYKHLRVTKKDGSR